MVISKKDFPYSFILFGLMAFAVFFSACQDDTPDLQEELPLMSIPDSLVVDEGDDTHTLLFDVRLSFPMADTVVAFLSTEDGNATAGQDYIALDNVPVIFEPGALRATMSVTILGNYEFEPDKHFKVLLQAPLNATIENGEMVIVLLNDDFDTSFRIPEQGKDSPTSYEGMRLVWADEFDRTDWDGTYWTHEIGTGNNGWGNNELQYYRPENTYFADGHLVIEAKRENFGGRAYTSSRIITENKFDVRYGRIDIRASMPFGQGMWPALWMLGSNFKEVGWPRCGEIDIMEMVGGGGRERIVHGTAHWQHGNNKADFGGSFTLPNSDLHESFHVFSIIWTENEIRWLIDDIQYHQMAITDPELSEFRLPFFFIFNVAVGGTWPGGPDLSTRFPQRMIVDYVRVFQQN